MRSSRLIILSDTRLYCCRIVLRGRAPDRLHAVGLVLRTGVGNVDALPIPKLWRLKALVRRCGQMLLLLRPLFVIVLVLLLRCRWRWHIARRMRVLFLCFLLVIQRRRLCLSPFVQEQPGYYGNKGSCHTANDCSCRRPR